MTLQGKFQNGVIVLEGNPALAEGTPVTVLVEPPQASALTVQTDRMTEEERRRINEIMDRIAALPDENPNDDFSARDHDKVLYGKP